jgi:hypothetical protein
MNDHDANVALLRRYEPAIRYTRGEYFFPMEVGPYVQRCSLWVQHPNKPPLCLVPAGKLTLERLARPHIAEFGSIHYLKIAEPLNAAKMAAYTLRERRKPKDPRLVFHAGRGRLARVGYTSRMIDALFSLSLLARGRVPGDAAAAAKLISAEIRQEHQDFHYYGRVLQQDGWIVLQYWFFYLFNNWRSGFFGANDHEADWEMICIYLYEDSNGELTPEWIAFASHDYKGDDLRRRWDDPEVEKVGEHPVIYTGAGSHASYFRKGEYLTELELPFLRPVSSAAERLHKFWHENLRQYTEQHESPDYAASRDIFRIPFVDYARGDGLTIGPGQEHPWGGIHLLDPTPPWVSQYRGLWGLYTRDPFSGEDAPAGPMYNRDGSVRNAWYDPVGWAGLDKVPPPSQALGRLQTRQAEILLRMDEWRSQIQEKSYELRGLGLETEAALGQPHLNQAFKARQKQIQELSTAINRLRAQIAESEALLQALDEQAKNYAKGLRGSLRSHIHRAHMPAPDVDNPVSRLAEIWAAASVGLMLIGFVALTWFAPQYLLVGLVTIIALFIFIEAGFRRRLTRLLSNVVIGLAVAASLILVYEFFWPIAITAVLAAGSYILWDNLRELWT